MITNENIINAVTSFNFRVLFKGLESRGDFDSRFQSISGIKATLDFKNSSNQSGDKNNVIKTQFNPVILRRAMADPVKSVLLKWILRCLNESVWILYRKLQLKY